MIPDNTDPRSAARDNQDWIGRLESAKQWQREWIERGNKLVDKFCDDRARERGVGADERRYAVFYANVMTIGPAIYNQTPKPEIGRRFKDADPVGLAASEALERIISASLDHSSFDRRMRATRDDNLIVSRGQMWVQYTPVYQELPVQPDPMTGMLIDETGAPLQDMSGITLDGDGQPVRRVLIDQKVEVLHLNWQDFGTNKAREWDEVRFVWRRVYMNRAELVERFGPIGENVPLDRVNLMRSWDDQDSKGDDEYKQAEIYEVWDKPSKTVRWISLGYAREALDIQQDPLGLEGFFPCPLPLNAVTGPDTLLPTADYVFYQDQAEEINTLTDRIGLLTDALRLRGVYAGSENTTLQRVLSGGRGNELIPIQNWAVYKDMGGLSSIIEWVPLEMVASTLKACIEARAQLLDDVHEISGISDIMRGASDPDETYGAQGIKERWGSIRVRDRQTEIARFARDIIRIMAEVIALHWTPEQMQADSGLVLPKPQPGQQPVTWPAIKQLLANRHLRDFRLDIETDSTIEADQNAEKQRRTEFVGVLGDFLAKSLPQAEKMPALLPLLSETLMFLVRGYRAGRSLENIIETTMQQIQQQPPPQQPPGGGKGPSPEQIAIQAGHLQLDQQVAAQKAQEANAHIALAARKLQGQQQMDGAKLLVEQQRTMTDMRQSMN